MILFLSLPTLFLSLSLSVSLPSLKPASREKVREKHSCPFLRLDVRSKKTERTESQASQLSSRFHPSHSKDRSETCFGRNLLRDDSGSGFFSGAPEKLPLLALPDQSAWRVVREEEWVRAEWVNSVRVTFSLFWCPVSFWWKKINWQSCDFFPENKWTLEQKVSPGHLRNILKSLTSLLVA